MGLFSKREPEPIPEPVVEPHRRSGLFNRRTTPPAHQTTTTTTHSARHNNGYAADSTQHRRSLLHRNGAEDASITNARQRVMSAEAAERDADKALLNARAAVREARDHVRRLEREAEEEARLANIKMKQAADISKRGERLGRHGAHH